MIAPIESGSGYTRSSQVHRMICMHTWQIHTKKPTTASLRLTHDDSPPTVHCGLESIARASRHYIQMQGHTARKQSPIRAPCWRLRWRRSRAPSHGARTHAARHRWSHAASMHAQGARLRCSRCRSRRCRAAATAVHLDDRRAAILARRASSQPATRESNQRGGVSPYANNHLRRPTH